MNNFERASVLSEALPYIRAFTKKTVVVKYDGKAIQTEESKKAVISDIVLLSLVGVRVVVVHGGGPENDAVLKAMGKEQKLVEGKRYVDQENMNVIQMTLAGKIGKDIVTMIADEGGKAFGFSGLDASLFTAKKSSGGADYGLVGEITTIDPELVTVALDNGYIPVVAAIARGEDADVNYDINADAAASELAVKLGAEKLILLTEACGIEDEKGGVMSELYLSKVLPLIKKGVISGEMVHKVDCCVKAVRKGVPRAHILDGRLAHSVLVEMLTESGVGTMILQD